jgi:hypothetical protein
MQFICDSGHKFHYPAKLTINNRYDLYDALGSKLYNVPEGQTAGFAMPLKQVPSEILETDVCPFCQSKTFTEYVEPVVDVDVLEDMQLVEWAMVSTFIAKGYVELDRKDHVFAKGVIMLKTKPTAPENAAPIVMRQEKDYISEALETAAAVVEKVKQP